MGNGYKITGPNGNSITFTAMGVRLCNGDVSGVGTTGFYCSFILEDSDYAWFLHITSSAVGTSICLRCYGLLVRLVM